jgi:hypothetical protein
VKVRYLESSGQATVGSRVTDRGTHVKGDLGMSVYQRGARLAVAHASVFKDILSVLAVGAGRGRLLYCISTKTSRKWMGPKSFMVNSRWRVVVVLCRSSVREVVRRMSST